MRLLLALLALPLAASTISYTIDQCGANCPVPYYALPKPGSPKLPNIEQLRAFVGGPAGYYLIHATDWRGGWTVGDFYGPSAWDGSWIFDGQALYCCKGDDERWMQKVNDYGDSVSIMASDTIVRLAGFGEITFNRTLGISNIDDNGVLYGPGFVMRPPAYLSHPQGGVAVTGAVAAATTESPEPGALWLVAGGAALIALKRRRVLA